MNRLNQIEHIIYFHICHVRRLSMFLFILGIIFLFRKKVYQQNTRRNNRKDLLIDKVNNESILHFIEPIGGLEPPSFGNFADNNILKAYYGPFLQFVCEWD